MYIAIYDDQRHVFGHCRAAQPGAGAPVEDESDESEELSHAAAAEAAWYARQEMAEDLRTGWSEADIDPLLSTLASLRNRRLRLEAEMRLLIAYGRCFTHPRPYKLIDLADAAGMSISGSVPPTTPTRSTRPHRSSNVYPPPRRSRSAAGNGSPPAAMDATDRPGAGSVCRAASV